MDIRLCGRLALEHNGESLEDKLPGRQGRLLLAYLALAGGRAGSRNELIEALWHHRPPADPDAALRTLLSRLRAALPEGKIEGRRELSLSLGAGDRLDLEEAHRALDRARSAAAQGAWEAAEAAACSALDVAGAPLLPGHDASRSLRPKRSSCAPPPRCAVRAVTWRLRRPPPASWSSESHIASRRTCALWRFMLRVEIRPRRCASTSSSARSCAMSSARRR